MASDFATAPTTTSTYDDVSYAAIITDQVLDALMAVVVTPALLDFYDLSGEASKAVKIPKADKFTAAAVNEGTELTNTALTTTSVTGTAAEIGIQATVTDVLELSDIPAAHGARLRQLGRALADKVDVDICALMAGFSSVVGATGVNITLANLLDAIYTLEVADASSLGALVGVLHPRQTADLREALDAESGAVYGGAGFQAALTDGRMSKSQAGYFGNFFGIDIFQSTNVPTANGGADRAGGIFVRDYALAMVQKWAAKVEPMRWAPIRGWVLVATAMYGVFEVEDAAGVEVTTDA
jgi:N4-gp56 family major capsid protein